ncbi:MAG: succinate dehydrogenase cytochrome b subunit [Bacteroidales bacterium]|nr:succinate dehydrogenase cytochrome b subunit [Bacteroidales bacterium]
MFLRSSIGQKLLMSITGLFLILFLMIHLIVNLFLVFDNTGELFNKAAHFMATNPVIRIIEPVLFIGFIIHIIYASLLTLKNQFTRPQKYKVINRSMSSTWSSRNMYILGGLVLTFLVIHIINFYYKIRFGGMHDMMITYDGIEMENAYFLVAGLLGYWWYTLIYVAGAVFLGLHLHHAFWSAFQTIGWSNIIWRKRLEIIGDIYAIIVPGGFAFIALFFLFKTCL